jgi:putative transposase
VFESSRQGIRASLGRHEAYVAAGLPVRHDHGSVHVSATFQDEPAALSIAGSPVFVRKPVGGGRAERLVRTLRENLSWVESFATLADLQQALAALRRRSNEERLIGRHDFRSPARARAELATPRARAA